MAMIETWRKFLDIGSDAEALLTDLSKTFDHIDHDRLQTFDCIAKLHAYSFDTDALKFIYSYIKGRKQNTKINSSYSFLSVVVPQGSILGPLLLTLTYVMFLRY